MAVTIKKIAELAGVSRGTVDRALNDRGGVKDEVKENILNIAKSLGYKPNLVAKSLATRANKHKIGVLVNAKGNDFFSEVFSGIDDCKNEIADFGFSVEIENMQGFDVDEQLDAIDKLLKSGITALAITPINDIKITTKLSKLNDMGIPIVTLNTDIEGCDFATYVGCDYYKSGQTAGGMMGLVTKGIGNVLIVTGSYRLLGHHLRVKGFLDVLIDEYPNVKIIDTVESNDNNDIGYEVVTKALQTHDNISAVYFAAGGAVGGVKAIIDHDKHHKIKIITNDLTEDRIKHIKSGIIDASICQQPYQQGYIAIKSLFDHLMGITKMDGQKKHTQIGIKMKYNF